MADLNKDVAAITTQIAATADDAERAALQQRLSQLKIQIAELQATAESPEKTLKAAKAFTAEGDVFRVLFFVLTFFSIGLGSNFKSLRQEGIGKLAAVYVICQFDFVIWIGPAISWLFFQGVLPPVLPALSSSK